jgi:hypothetical protein
MRHSALNLDYTPSALVFHIYLNGVCSCLTLAFTALFLSTVWGIMFSYVMFRFFQ